jgi:hypothetical protein
MFKILSTHPHPSAEILDQSTRIVKHAQTVRSNALDVTLYERAKLFVVNGGTTKGVDVGVERAGDQNTSAALDGALATAQPYPTRGISEVGGRREFAPFQPLVMAVFACPMEPWRQPERSRKSRVDLALALFSEACKSRQP